MPGRKTRRPFCAGCCVPRKNDTCCIPLFPPFVSNVSRAAHARPGARATKIEALRHEPVTHTGLRDKVARASCVGFEFLAKLCHVDTQVMRMLYVRGAPNIA